MANKHILRILLFVTLVTFPLAVLGITTIHHDKPEESRIFQMANKMNEEVGRRVPSSSSINQTQSIPERQKRLLPYINYYLGNNYQKPSLTYQNKNKYQHHEKITPFLDSNAIPGPFIPMLKYPEKNYVVASQQENIPNFPGIYDKLTQLKLVLNNNEAYVQNHNPQPTYRKPQINYVPIHQYNNLAYKNYQQPSKTTIETYTPTNIDIISDNTQKHYPKESNNLLHDIYRQQPQYITIDVPQQQQQHNYEYPQPIVATIRPYIKEKGAIIRKPFLYGQKLDTEIEKPIIYAIQTKPKPQVNTIIDDKYEAQKFTPVNNDDAGQYAPVQFLPDQYSHNEEYSQITPSPYIPTVVTTTTETTNTLGQILKQLQDTNTLPQTLTPENIDNSIKTLVRILNGLKKQQKLFSKPTEESPEEIDESDLGVIEQPAELAPGTVTQNFPANTIEGGTPGRPGVDYPALSSIPQTSFNCKTQRYKGFFGDPHTNCQVWHYCDLNGGQASFLCPNGTIFSQVALTCDWWYNVKCSSTAQLYVLNERLYKYILPLSPKFPEDYSGPLVDKYLALKFKEMEEKMSKDKKKGDSEEVKEEEKDDSDQLQDIQNENRAKSSEET